MEKHLQRLPEDILRLIYRARSVADERGAGVYLVGGFVRDLILGRKNYDLDIAVEGAAIPFAQRFARGMDGRLVIHTRFGTATLILASGLKLDFATTRKESYPHPGALPVVLPGSLKDDLYRRDFTVNTLAVSCSGASFGTLLDVFKGREDLAAGIIRVLHDQSFIDDPTRILRAVRFEQRFGFRIEPHTLRLLKAAVGEKMLLKVQPHRLRDELVLMLKEEVPLRPIRRLSALAGFDFLAPGMKIRGTVFRLFEAIRRESVWYREHCSPAARVEPWVIYLAALFTGARPAEAEECCRRFAFGKGERERVLGYVSEGARTARALSAVLSTSRLFRILEPLPYEVVLLIKAAASNPAVGKNIDTFLSACRGICVSVSGHDLRRMGIAPGPEYRRIFKRLLDAKLDGKVCSREEELAFVKRIRTSG